MRNNPLTRVVNWLRAGYPEGVPPEDYVALFGILHRDLTTAEIEHVVRILREDPAYPSTTSAFSEDQIRAAIESLVHERAGDHDIERVRAHLAASRPAAPGYRADPGDHDTGDTGPDLSRPGSG
jgi:hypothetical protein